MTDGGPGRWLEMTDWRPLRVWLEMNSECFGGWLETNWKCGPGGWLEMTDWRPLRVWLEMI